MCESGEGRKRGVCEVLSSAISRMSRVSSGVRHCDNRWQRHWMRQGGQRGRFRKHMERRGQSGRMCERGERKMAATGKSVRGKVMLTRKKHQNPTWL